MRQIVHIVGIALFCAIAISNAGAASETGGGRYSLSAVAQQVVKPAEENTTKIEVVQDEPTQEQKNTLNDFIQQHYKMDAEAASSCGGTGQIAACSGACSAACIFKCFPPNTPWDEGCKTCVNACMDKCTGCGSGSGAIQ
jgi:hypothetical protein